MHIGGTASYKCQIMTSNYEETLILNHWAMIIGVDRLIIIVFIRHALRFTRNAWVAFKTLKQV